jgi:serine/threonine protein kinase
MIDGRPSGHAGAPVGAEDIFGIGRPIGEILRDFRLLSKLGEGGMGIVYKAHQLSLDQDVALKILRPQLAENRDFVARFYREARMSVQLKDNANIVHGIAVGFACALCDYNGPPEEHALHPGVNQERGVHYFAMEFVEGDNLEHWLTRLGRLPVGDAVKITIDVAHALGYAHSRKRPIFHRDVKPVNIMVTPDGEVKLADLGLAKAAEDDSGLTQIGEMAGTPAYMPPEQARNAAMVDGRSDIYALGATLYVLLTGKKPFAGKTIPAIVEAKELGKFEPAHTVNAEVPETLDRILTRMLAADVSKRYQTAGQVAAALTELGLATKSLGFLDQETTVTGQSGGDTSNGHTRRWQSRTLGGALAIVLIAGIYSLVRVAGYHFFQPPHALETESQPAPAPPNAEPADMVLAHAMEQIASDQINAARGTLQRGLTDHPGDGRIERPLLELERGSLVLFQHQTPDETSPMGPIWTADGVTLTDRDNYRFCVVLAHECYLYAYQRDTRPSVTLIFPNPRYSPLSNPLAAGTLVWLPSDPKRRETSWWHLDKSTGEERVYFVAVTAPLRDPVGLGNQLEGETDRSGSALKQSLSTLLKGHTPDGMPAQPCFAADTAVQVFRFEHKGVKSAPHGKGETPSSSTTGRPALAARALRGYAVCSLR